MSEAIIIPNVNVELLEEQRLALVRVTSAMSLVQPAGVTEEDVKMLDGLLHMLDYWSDERLKRNPIQPPTNRRKKDEPGRIPERTDA